MRGQYRVHLRRTWILGLLSLASSFRPAIATAADWAWAPSFSLTQQFTDNLFATETAEEVDTITTISPSLSVGARGPVWNQSFRYALSAEYLWRNPTVGTIYHAGSYRADINAGPLWKFEIVERASYSPETTQEIFPEASAEPQLIRVRSIRSTTQIVPLLRVTERADLRFQTEGFIQRFEEGQLLPGSTTTRVSNTYEAAETLILDYRWTERDTVSPAAGLTRFWLGDSPDAWEIAGSLAWARNWTPTFSTSVGAGVSETFQSGGSNSTDFTGSFSAQRDLEHWSVRVGYGRSIVARAGLGSALVQDSATLGVDWRPVEKLGFTGAGGYYHTSSTQDAMNLGIHGAFLNTGFSLRIRDGITGSCSYTYRIQDTAGGLGTSFSQNQAAITLSVTSPSAQPFK